MQQVQQILAGFTLNEFKGTTRTGKESLKGKSSTSLRPTRYPMALSFFSKSATPATRAWVYCTSSPNKKAQEASETSAPRVLFKGRSCSVDSGMERRAGPALLEVDNTEEGRSGVPAAADPPPDRREPALSRLVMTASM